jgi:anti-sigma B factor antagonist
VQIQERVTNEVGILRLAGRLTVNDQPGLLKQAIADLGRKGARHVILDLGGVRYLDSTRLGELIAAHVMLSRNGGRMILAATPPRVLELLVLSSLAGVFERFDSVEAAEATFTATPV